jgi:hypothetical protein
VTATTINLGVLYVSNYDQANANNGGASITGGDPLTEAQLVVREINAHGGIAGRRIVPTYVGYDRTSNLPSTAQDQAACSKLTQDHHVFAVLGAGLTLNLRACVEKAGGIDVGTSIVEDNADVFRRYPHYVDVQAIDTNEFASTLVRVLVRHKWGSGWNATTGTPAAKQTKVGVVAYNTAAFRDAITHQLLPSLRSAGMPVSDSDVVYINVPAAITDDAAAATALQGALLRFSQHGVNHVIVGDYNGALTQLLMIDAQTQGYRPRYAVGSGSGLEAYLEGGLVPRQQLVGTVGLGWLPMLDLAARDNPDSGRYSSAARRSCLALMRHGGQIFTSSNAKSIALLYCDQFHVLQQTLHSFRHRAVNRDVFMSAINHLGTSVASASLGVASFGPNKHFAAARAWAWEYSGACTCMRYVGAPERVA